MSQLDFLNTYYGKVAWIYDISRAYYLLGRDQLMRNIAHDVPQHGKIVEVGAGTGRNLAKIRRMLAQKQASLYCIEPCEPMRKVLENKNQQKQLGIHVVDKMGEHWDHNDVHGRPDIIFFSYALSMFPDPRAAIENALSQLKPGGTLYIVDFGSMLGLKQKFYVGYKLLRWWLLHFHVNPWKLWLDLEGLVIDEAGSSAYFDYYRLVKIKAGIEPHPKN